MFGVLEGLVNADTMSFNRVNFEQSRGAVLMEPAPTLRALSDLNDRARANVREHPMIVQSERTGATAVMRTSAFTTSHELHRTRLYDETFRPLRIDYLVSEATPIDCACSGRDSVHAQVSRLQGS